MFVRRMDVLLSEEMCKGKVKLNLEVSNDELYGCAQKCNRIIGCKSFERGEWRYL